MVNIANVTEMTRKICLKNARCIYHREVTGDLDERTE